MMNVIYHSFLEIAREKRIFFEKKICNDCKLKTLILFQHHFSSCVIEAHRFYPLAPPIIIRNQRTRNPLIATVDALPPPSGSTDVAVGMEEASRLLSCPTSIQVRNNVVIVFTDGVPSSGSNFDTAIATRAIEVAHNIKNSGATFTPTELADFLSDRLISELNQEEKASYTILDPACGE